MNYKFLFIVILFSFSFFIDKQFVLFLSGNRIELLNSVAYYITAYFNTIVIFILISLFLFIKERKRLFSFISSFFSAGILVLIIKFIVNRTRPFIALSLDKINGVNYDFINLNSSFPSWHSIAVFLVLPFLDGKYKIVWFFIAIIVIFFRVYTGVHYLSDVLFGSLIGYFIGYIVRKRFG